jgi:peroxiredoxin
MSVVGFGKRSKRFAAVINDSVVEMGFVEPSSTADNPDPYGVSSPETVMAYLETRKKEFLKDTKNQEAVAA